MENINKYNHYHYSTSEIVFDKFSLLDKEKEQYRQKNHDLEVLVTKLNKDIEFLTAEGVEKEDTCTHHMKEMKLLREEIKLLHSSAEKDHNEVDQLKEKVYSFVVINNREKDW